MLQPVNNIYVHWTRFIRLKYGIFVSFGDHIHNILLNISTCAHMVNIVGLMNDEDAIRLNDTAFCYYQRDQI